MSQTQSAFDGMPRQLVNLGLSELDTEPFDVLIEWWLKQFWGYTTCPRCGHPSIHAWGSFDRAICRDYNFKLAYIYGTPFHKGYLTTREALLAYLLYADTLLSISQIAVVLNRAYKTVYYTIRGVETTVTRGFPPVWERFQYSISGPIQIDESGTIRSGYKDQDPPRTSRYRDGSSWSGRLRRRGRHGDQMTLVAACHDVLRVTHGHLGISYQGDLEPTLREARGLSQRLGEIRTDGPQAYREIEYDHQTVTHDEQYVSADGVHVNRAEYLFSLVKP